MDAFLTTFSLNKSVEAESAFLLFYFLAPLVSLFPFCFDVFVSSSAVIFSRPTPHRPQSDRPKSSAPVRASSARSTTSTKSSSSSSSHGSPGEGHLYTFTSEEGREAFQGWYDKKMRALDEARSKGHQPESTLTEVCSRVV